MSDIIYAREYWTGDSRDGSVVGGEGCHYFKLGKDGTIHEAWEVYEEEDGAEVVSPVPELQGVNWMSDLGYEDWDVLDVIDEGEFERVKGLFKG